MKKEKEDPFANISPSKRNMYIMEQNRLNAIRMRVRLDCIRYRRSLRSTYRAK